MTFLPMSSDSVDYGSVPLKVNCGAFLAATVALAQLLLIECNLTCYLWRDIVQPHNLIL
jgi:hypothetical protein